MWESFETYIAQLWYAISIKGALAAVACIYTDKFLGNTEVFIIYLCCMVVDLICGSLRAIVYGSWCPEQLGRWLRKLFTHLIVIGLFGWVYRQFFINSEISFPFVNWILFCITITETTSILYNLSKLGMPVPPIANVFIKIIRRAAVGSLVHKIGDPEIAKELRDALDAAEHGEEKK